MAEEIKNEEARTVLLTPDENGKMKVVSGEDEATGKVTTVDPTKENAAGFKLFDTEGDMFANFVKRFSEQSQNPSHTGFYAVAATVVDKLAAFFDKIIQINPDDHVLDPYRVTPQGKMLEPRGERFPAHDLNRLDWNDVVRMGLLGDTLTDALKAMAYGHKSKLMDVKELSCQARLSLVERPDGTLRIQMHPRQEKPDFDKPFMGVEFTDRDIEQFQLTGNGGRVFELVTPDGEMVPSLVSLDRQTNRFDATPLSEISIPKTLKGVELTGNQQERLKAGEGVLVENMKKNVKPGEQDKGETITRIVQYNAADRNFDFILTPQQQEQYRQAREQRQAAEGSDDATLRVRKVGDVWVRPVQGGVALTREQFEKVCAGEAVFVNGMQSRRQPQAGASAQVEATDQKGQKYNAWVWIDPAKGHVRHTSKHPDQIRAMEAKQAAKQGVGVKPAAGYRTQVAVNSDGKTNEATKHAQSDGKPMKQGQTSDRQQRTIQAPRKGRGQKV